MNRSRSLISSFTLADIKNDCPDPPNFGEYNMWLAAENGMFLRPTKGSWMTTMPEHLNMEWFDSVKHVFEYFTERTPRSHFELRETSLVWNYKYAGLGICLMMVYRSAV